MPTGKGSNANQQLSNKATYILDDFLACVYTGENENLIPVNSLTLWGMITAFNRTIAVVTSVQEVCRDNVMLSIVVLHLGKLGLFKTSLLHSFLIFIWGGGLLQ